MLRPTQRQPITFPKALTQDRFQKREGITGWGAESRTESGTESGTEPNTEIESGTESRAETEIEPETEPEGEAEVEVRAEVRAVTGWEPGACTVVLCGRGFRFIGG